MPYAFFFVSILALAGCAATVETLPTDFRLGTTDESAVLGRIEMVDANGRPLTVAPTALIGHMLLVVVNEATGKEYSVKCANAGLVSPFAVGLPPGQYRITRVLSGALRNVTTPAHGRFVVRPRQVTYIGTLRFVGKGVMPYVSGSWTVLDESDEALKAFQASRPGTTHDATVSLVTEVLAVQGLRLPFDSRQWRVGYEASREDYQIVEWVLPGETVENWTELVTTQTFPGAQRARSIERVVEEARSKTLGDCPTARWSVIQSGLEAILYEWETRGCARVEEQYEVAKLLTGFVAIHRVAYTVRRKAVNEEVRTEWKRLIGQAHLRRVGETSVGPKP